MGKRKGSTQVRLQVIFRIAHRELVDVTREEPTYRQRIVPREAAGIGLGEPETLLAGKAARNDAVNVYSAAGGVSVRTL